jgi:MscS family membrane protein
MVNVYSPLAMVFLIIGYSGALWLIGAILNRIAGTVIRVGGFVTGNVDTQLIRFGFDFITVGIILATIVHFGGRLGLPTYSLVGGLGIGGLAIALAGREALSNLIGTIVILLDRPFKIGDYVLIGDKIQGTVLNIGLRSTRI